MQDIKECHFCTTFVINIIVSRDLVWDRNVGWGLTKSVCWLKHISPSTTHQRSPAEQNGSWLNAEFKYISKCELSNHSAFSQHVHEVYACIHYYITDTTQVTCCAIDYIGCSWLSQVIELNQPHINPNSSDI